MRIEIDLPPDRARRYGEALSRIREVEIVSSGPADALITKDLSQVESASSACLLDAPEALPLADWQGVEEQARRCFPAHVWRFLPSVLPVHQALAAGKLGDPGLLRTHHWLPGAKGLGEVAFHQVDLALWFFGQAPDSRFTMNRPHYRQLHFGFPGDGMAVIDLATRRPGSDAYFSLHLIGSKGAAYADDHRNQHLLFSEGGTRALLHRQEERLGLQHLLQQFVDGVREGVSRWTVTLEDSIRVHRLLREVSDD